MKRILCLVPLSDHNTFKCTQDTFGAKVTLTKVKVIRVIKAFKNEMDTEEIEIWPELLRENVFSGLPMYTKWLGLLEMHQINNN